MGDVRNEPSMEDILASIKRIIAEDGAAAVSAPRARAANRPPPAEGSSADSPPAGSLSAERAPAAEPEPAPAPQLQPPEGAEPVLELTDPLGTPLPTAASLVSANAALASRQSLAALSAMVVRPEADAEAPSGNTLEALVRDLLRPLLKDWLDAKLPELVETLVAREIARITGKAL